MYKEIKKGVQENDVKNDDIYKMFVKEIQDSLS